MGALIFCIVFLVVIFIFTLWCEGTKIGRIFTYRALKHFFNQSLKKDNIRENYIMYNKKVYRVYTTKFNGNKIVFDFETEKELVDFIKYFRKNCNGRLDKIEKILTT